MKKGDINSPYHVYAFMLLAILYMPVFAAQSNAGVEETSQDVAQEICNPECNFSP